MDRIAIHDLAVDCIVGVHPWEREAEQRLFLDVELELDLGPAAASDAVADTVDYDAAAREIARIAREGRFRLLEALAYRVADHLLEEPRVASVRVRVKKPRAILAAAWAAVEVERRREAGAG